MKNKVHISKSGKKAVDSIKASISDKKKKHQELIESINPAIVKDLQKMKKVEFPQK